ncbi:ApbE family lipoprotein [Acetonema longum DSM 6540]|uniref:FAD:protein FMN transferase n=2 Tax=Acetonema TaxID=2373 RepID=F7NPJ4_9FIRM|nr:ApbE family lipoprotein [Acetonema longum DSM 6540]
MSRMEVSSHKNKAFESRDFVMGTLISQKVYGAQGQAAIDSAMKRMNELEKLLTFKAEQGDVYKLNQNAGKEKIALSSDTIKILRKSQQVAELSSGAFDITVGPLVKSWAIGTPQEHIPSYEELKKILPLINFRDLYVDDSAASLKRPGQMVDLGGIAKGFAGDEVIRIYKKFGIRSAFVNIGGNVITLGNKPDGTPWRVGIRNPRPDAGQTQQSEQILATVEVVNKAVVTAGDEQRYFIKDGIRYHHILDPVTGYPARSDLMSVTLIMDSSFDADALDTAVFILGLEKGRELIRQFGGIEAVFITADKKIYITDGIKGSFKLYNEGNEYKLAN